MFIETKVKLSIVWFSKFSEGLILPLNEVIIHEVHYVEIQQTLTLGNAGTNEDALCHALKFEATKETPRCYMRVLQTRRDPNHRNIVT